MKRRQYVVYMIIALTIACGFAASSGAAYVMGVDEDNERLDLFNIDDNSITPVGFGLPDEIESLAYAGGPTYYGFQSYNASLQSQLYKFDVEVGLSGFSSTPVGGPLDISNIDSAAYVDGKLYTVNNVSRKLYRVETDGSGFTEVMDLGSEGIHSKVEGMTLDPSSGKLYLMDSASGGVIYTIDGLDTTPVLAELGDTGFQNVEGLAFAEDGNLYGIADAYGGNTELFVISLADGSGTSLFDGWGSDIEGLASFSSYLIPEPASAIAFLTVVVVGIAAARRPRRACA